MAGPEPDRQSLADRPPEPGPGAGALPHRDPIRRRRRVDLVYGRPRERQRPTSAEPRRSRSGPDAVLGPGSAGGGALLQTPARRLARQAGPGRPLVVAPRDRPRGGGR